MKRFLALLTLIVIFHTATLYAFQPIIPPANDYNMQNIKRNFDSVQTARVTFPSGATSYVFAFPCSTTDAVLASVNTQTSAEISFVEPLGNTVNIGFKTAPATDLTISLFTVLNN